MNIDEASHKIIQRTARRAAVFVSLFSLAFVETIVFVFGGFLPEPYELFRAGAFYFMIAVYFVWYAVQYVYETAAFQLETKLLVKRQRNNQRGPQPQLFQSHTAMRNHVQYKRGVEGFIPAHPEHYQAIYYKLQRQGWRITRRALSVKFGKVPAFRNLTQNFTKIIQHWNSLNFIEGWETGDANKDTWHLNENGQAWLVKQSRGRVPSPTQ